MSVEEIVPVMPKRAGIYVRIAPNYPGAPEDQERACREYAQGKGLVVVDDFVRTEVGKSGLNLKDRPMLSSLMSDASKEPRPFDVLIVDETCRLSRHLGDVLTITDRLNNNGVELQIVGLQLNSSDPNFRLMLTMFAATEENFREHLRRKVLNGMEKRVRSGSSAGGSHFGFYSVPAEDDTARTHRRGHKLQVLESEAATIRRIFQLFAAGSSASRIATSLNEEHVPSPKNRRNREQDCWNRTTVEGILQNSLYIGKMTWNKTRQSIDPATGERRTRTNPPHHWVYLDVPVLRLIPDDLWNRAQERMKVAKQGLTRHPDRRAEQVQGKIEANSLAS